MPKLNQVNALVAGKKGEVQKAMSEYYHAAKKREGFDGLQRHYRPLDEQTGEKLPSEQKRVQQTAKSLMKQFAASVTVLVDLIATQDHGNQLAVADIVVDDVVLLSSVPVTTLLFLEKQVNDWITFITHFPTPEAGETWEYDEASDLLRTPPSQTVRTKKAMKAFVKYEATKEHPAQVDTFTEDVMVGTWTLVQYTGRLPTKEKNEILVRLSKLRDAVKVAREHANNLDVKALRIGETLFTYAFGLTG